MKIKIIKSGLYTEEIPQYILNVWTCFEDAIKIMEHERDYKRFAYGTIHNVIRSDKIDNMSSEVQFEDLSAWEMKNKDFKII